VHDDGDYGEDHQQVDEKAGDVKESQAEDPTQDQNNREDEEHGTYFLATEDMFAVLPRERWNRAQIQPQATSLQAMRDRKTSARCSGGKNRQVYLGFKLFRRLWMGLA
jgi:hypothetical protein